eukprot:15239545-Alexandrium_andersonii.AAC.1
MRELEEPERLGELLALMSQWPASFRRMVKGLAWYTSPADTHEYTPRSALPPVLPPFYHVYPDIFPHLQGWRAPGCGPS